MNSKEEQTNSKATNSENEIFIEQNQDPNYINEEIGDNKSIEIEDCEQISKQISSVLDVEDVIQGEYVLEVSSPGIDRPLFSSEHFKKYVGSRVFCKLRIPKYGRRKFNGILSVAGDSDIEIKMDAASYSLSYIEIENANLIYDY